MLSVHGEVGYDDDESYYEPRALENAQKRGSTFSNAVRIDFVVIDLLIGALLVLS